ADTHPPYHLHPSPPPLPPLPTRRSSDLQQRIRRPRRPAGQHDAVHTDRGDRQDIQHGHGHIGQLQRRLGVSERNRDFGAERDHRPGHERRDRRDDRRQGVHDLIGRPHEDVFFEGEFDAVGQTLQQPERTPHIGADAVLHPSYYAPFKPDIEQREQN